MSANREAPKGATRSRQMAAFNGDPPGDVDLSIFIHLYPVKFVHIRCGCLWRVQPAFAPYVQIVLGVFHRRPYTVTKFHRKRPVSLTEEIVLRSFCNRVAITTTHLLNTSVPAAYVNIVKPFWDLLNTKRFRRRKHDRPIIGQPRSVQRYRFDDGDVLCTYPFRVSLDPGVPNVLLPKSNVLVENLVRFQSFHGYNGPH